MTRIRRGKYNINNSLWGPEADSIKSGYRVPFGKINIFVGMVGSRVPEPDIFTDIVEPARYVRHVATSNLTRSVFVGFTQGCEEPERSAIQETTPFNTHDELSMGDSDSIQSLHGGCLGGLSLAMDPEVLDRTRRQIAVYMAGATQPQQNPTGNDGTGETSRSPAVILMDLAAEITRLTATLVTTDNQDTINAELTKLRDGVAKAQRDVEAEAARIKTRQAQITAETTRLNTENWRLRGISAHLTLSIRGGTRGVYPLISTLPAYSTLHAPPGQEMLRVEGRANRQTRRFSQRLIASLDSRHLGVTFATRWTTCSLRLAI
ncbi:hypothetical protein ZWY2020_007736 [Hordeum vulgare]|nr:hypothetical protein ZWY2020_007736 [Hordeum vulgare]